MRPERSRFSTGEVTFTVEEVEDYPAGKITRQYRGILDFRPGLLIAVAYRGALIPNITYDKGVWRLTKVSVDGTVFARPGAISKALGIAAAMQSMKLRKLS